MSSKIKMQEKLKSEVTRTLKEFQQSSLMWGVDEKEQFEKEVENFKKCQFLKHGNEKSRSEIFEEFNQKIGNSNIFTKNEETLRFLSELGDRLLKWSHAEQQRQTILKSLTEELTKDLGMFDIYMKTKDKQLQEYRDLQVMKVFPMEWPNIWEAARHGSLMSVKYWRLMDPKSIDRPRKYAGHETPLQLAVLHGHLPVVKFLLYMDADLRTAIPNTGITPVQAACYTGRLDILQALLRGLPSPNCLFTQQDNTPGWTALHWAVRGDNLPVVQYIVNFNSAINEYQDLKLRTAIQLAIQLHYSDIETYLRKYIIPDIPPTPQPSIPVRINVKSYFSKD